VTEVLLFHHALGLTDGVLAFADDLRAAGHVVHTPDLYEGKTFDTVPDGVANARSIGFGTIMERGAAAAEGLPGDLVYAGFSLGVMSAQALAQTRPGARGGLFLYAFLDPSEFDGPWPGGVPAQIHMMEDDPEVQEGDLDAARAFDAATETAELFLYPGDKHLFADRSFSDYDEAAASLLRERTLEFLARVGQRRGG
jgi:dienelactone hydrolase